MYRFCAASRVKREEREGEKEREREREREGEGEKHERERVKKRDTERDRGDCGFLHTFYDFLATAQVTPVTRN